MVSRGTEQALKWKELVYDTNQQRQKWSFETQTIPWATV